MRRVNDYSAEVLGWQRPPGPPRVWRVVESQKKSTDGKTLRFSIQEIPEDRYEDVLQHMSTTFARDSPLCGQAGVLNDPLALNDFQKIWIYALQQGIVVGAFRIDENNPKPPLIAINMIMVKSAAVERGMQAIELNSEGVQRIVHFMKGIEEEQNIRKLYNVDKYIAAFGLSVEPEYRDRGLAYHILQVRDNISAAYNINATANIFSCSRAQRVAARAGFEVLVQRDFVDIRKEDGTEVFPGILSKQCKLMGKRFCNKINYDTIV